VLPHAELCPQGLEFDARRGRKLVDELLVHGIAIEHACDKVCACATCHVHVREGADTLAPADDEEEDQLDDAWGLDAQSRLSCCVKLRGRHAGDRIAALHAQPRTRELIRPCRRLHGSVVLAGIVGIADIGWLAAGVPPQGAACRRRHPPAPVHARGKTVVHHSEEASTPARLQLEGATWNRPAPFAGEPPPPCAAAVVRRVARGTRAGKDLGRPRSSRRWQHARTTTDRSAPSAARSGPGCRCNQTATRTSGLRRDKAAALSATRQTPQPLRRRGNAGKSST
jgi:2Fe-2S ferredoxin